MDIKTFFAQIKKYLKNFNYNNTLFGLKPLEPITDFGYIKTINDKVKFLFLKELTWKAKMYGKK